MTEPALTDAQQATVDRLSGHVEVTQDGFGTLVFFQGTSFVLQEDGKLLDPTLND